jgi:hypothetical protein
LASVERPSIDKPAAAGDCTRTGAGTISGVPTIHIAQDAAADELLGRDPLALLIGMLLDQHLRQRCSDARG